MIHATIDSVTAEFNCGDWVFSEPRVQLSKIQTRVYSNDEETTLDSERLPPLWRVKRSISRQLLQTSTLQILRLGTVRPACKDTEEYELAVPLLTQP